MSDFLVDTHCHLTMGELGREADAAWDRARAAGVDRVLVVGITARESERVVDWARARPGLSAIVGIHPNETAKASDEDWQTIRELARDPAVAAVGESGLDLYWDDAPLDVQTCWLERHVELALELDKPLVLHIRDAFPESREALRPHVDRGLRGVVHCFGGEADDVHPFVDWGWPISFSGILTYPKAENVREAARRTPLEQCLVETDAPFLTPLPERGRTNEPAFVVHTARALAEVKGIDFPQLAAITTANAERVFALAPAHSEVGA